MGPLERVHRPAEDDCALAAELFHDALVEQALVDRDAVENERVDPTQERSKLPPRADGLKQTHVFAADERLEEPRGCARKP